MKALKTLSAILLALASFAAVAYGVLFLLQEDNAHDYIDIYGEDESAY